MAKDKKSVLLYCDIIHTVEKMDNETAGEFFKHYLRYINDLNPTTDNMVVDIAFESVKQNLKRDLKKYENICERNALNGSKGGRPKKPKKPSGLIGNPKEPKKADTDNDTDTDIDINNNTSAKADGIDFDLLLKFINKTLNKNFRTINKTLQAKFKARLKDGYTKEDIQKAILGASKSSFHKESNYKHLRPEFFSRADKIDMYSNSKTQVHQTLAEQSAHIKNNVGKNSI